MSSGVSPELVPLSTYADDIPERSPSLALAARRTYGETQREAQEKTETEKQKTRWVYETMVRPTSADRFGPTRRGGNVEAKPISFHCVAKSEAKRS